MSQVSRTVFSKMSEIVSNVSVVTNYQKLSKIAKIVQNCQKFIKNCHQNYHWKCSSKLSSKIVIENCYWKLSLKIVTLFFSIFDWSKRWNLGFWRSVHLFFVHIFASALSVKSVSGPMASTATFRFDLLLSNS